jgi:phospholipid N-methyltransferase
MTTAPRSSIPSVALGEFLRHPSMVGSAFPASQRMVRRMLDPLAWRAIDVMVEYGPGTGRFTFDALARMNPNAKLIAIETGEEFVDYLRSRSHDNRLAVVHGSASDVLDILADHGAVGADCILSGLPFSTLSHEEAEHVVHASATALGRSGIFAAYQMRTAIEPLLHRRFTKLRKGYEWWNIPPCHLYWASAARGVRKGRRSD